MELDRYEMRAAQRMNLAGFGHAADLDSPEVAAFQRTGLGMGGKGIVEPHAPLGPEQVDVDLGALVGKGPPLDRKAKPSAQKLMAETDRQERDAHWRQELGGDRRQARNPGNVRIARIARAGAKHDKVIGAQLEITIEGPHICVQG